MDIALCYESVLPNRGGCETYIADLSRRLARDGHRVHLYACRWDASALPTTMHYHRLHVKRGLRFLRPWRFAQACEDALAQADHDVTIGFDKTWGQDVLYPQGGLHAASQAYNRRKFPNAATRWLADLGKLLSPAPWSFARLERKQYLGPNRPKIVVNSRMVQRHFEEFLEIPADSIHVLPSAIDPGRFEPMNRLVLRNQERSDWGVEPSETVGLFVAMNYRLKGLAPLLHSVAKMERGVPFRLAVVGHPKTGRYEQLAAKLGISDRVKFLGFRADPKSAYFGADFLVHPTFYDPCSLVVLEALACGLPVVTTAFNGASELMHPGEDGFVVETPHDHAGIAQAMTRLCDPSFRAAAASKARQTGQSWTFEQHYQGLLRMFQDVAVRRRAA
ncbi:glycosyltransferase family 4 protein [Tuwongella immobilis]|uniref:Glycosyltransferase subfamily 4-like N-terminal domain-containing protein n=1 Tax=Tuwongella immobilis TaxID=692036 RepID=A0A6C2YLE4_9BACT|nr:glycosyltransferase family 4 protein [Tuwongella immobilis]VIP02131.1 Glycosyltransferase OS=Singulisphaera acidiphila (strain ATCC BAA-1392 / DSM 18658 / VKM B-2454 / MOB10) GN=Sinac_3097 PE=4 SV=1: Glyco_transf_4: Glycos_transf_1 [Tuwongella immobilis]VTS00479.1 Glycosyltransferase OS=Singulisphaera acidiphila (strain ATCC BAA-1392 / DSM 18658 / VKM B-2454 / MOB10) GN=Sinac_3097 PE=4 SV=1: Glyco_transf_4: Glycos_transf_1 [Tuwongella immobilis]